ncbi:MAG: hypothetical protein ACE37F_06725 [Nannocystaceae bacterium]|nr:hypothetical protein [bacterium]
MFVPRPSSDDPVARVHITLTSSIDGGQITGQVVEVGPSPSNTVSAKTSIEHQTQELLTVAADIRATASHQQDLEVNGSPTQPPLASHGANLQKFQWTQKPSIEDLEVRISGTLGPDDLNARLAVGSAGAAGSDYNEIWLVTPRGLTAAKLIVEFK